MPNLNETIAINGTTGVVIGLDPTGRKVLLRLANGVTVWRKVD